MQSNMTMILKSYDDDGGCVEKTKKGESLTSTRLINGICRCPSIDVNARSRDCHATDALRAISV